MQLPRPSSLSFFSSEKKVPQAPKGCVQRKEGGIIPAHNPDISAFRQCRVWGFICLKVSPHAQHPTGVQPTSLHSTGCPTSSPAVCFKNTALQLHSSQAGAVPALQTLHTDSTFLPSLKSLCKHYLWQKIIYASRHISFSVTLAIPAKHSSQLNYTHCRAFENNPTQL